MDINQIREQALRATSELLKVARLEAGDIFVIGCSSSEIAGEKIGSHSNTELANAVFEGVYPLLNQQGIFLAAQCCEHLNRALIIERAAVCKYGLEEVNVAPQPKAGGSFATAAYLAMTRPAAVEALRAKAGLDIGNTLIGMHLAAVAVPVRLSLNKIGEANLVAARTRAKFIGGSRAHYNEELL